jgi:hypothetical protein
VKDPADLQRSRVMRALGIERLRRLEPREPGEPRKAILIMRGILHAIPPDIEESK